MKKSYALLLAGLLTLSIAACGQTPTDPSASLESQSLVEFTSDTEVSSESTLESTPESSSETVLAEGIKDLFAKHGIKAGTCLTPQMTSNKKSSTLITSQFNSVTMENAMKPDYLFNRTKSQKTGDLVVELNKDAIKMLDWAKANNMSVRGHTLVWYSQTPQWIFYEDFNQSKALVSREVMLERLESYIKQVFRLLEEKGYTEIIYAYDVVNEAWMEDGTMRQNKWLETIGDDYLWQTFYLADKYAPESIDLYYNDYNEQYKTETLYKFAESLKDENGRSFIDGIGFQAHLYTSDNLTAYFETVDRLSQLGLKIELTELDVCLGAYQKPLEANEENLKKQGKFYYNLIQGLLERIDAGTLNMDALTFWGYSDSASWRKEYSPLLYDASLSPKYAYYGAIQDKENAGF